METVLNFERDSGNDSCSPGKPSKAEEPDFASEVCSKSKVGLLAPKCLRGRFRKAKWSQNAAKTEPTIKFKSIQIRGRISESNNDATDLRGRLWSPTWSQNGIQNPPKVDSKTDPKTEGPECSRRRSAEVPGGR